MSYVLTSHERLRRTLYKLLKCTCLHCFKLKMLDAEVSIRLAPCHGAIKSGESLVLPFGGSLQMVPLNRGRTAGCLL